MGSEMNEESRMETFRIAWDAAQKELLGRKLSPQVIAEAKERAVEALSLFMPELNRDMVSVVILDSKKDDMVLAAGNAYTEHLLKDFIKGGDSSE